MTAAVHARQNIGPGLGASEIAAALGLHPYKSPLALWEEKVGEREPFDGNDFTEWGLAVEPALLGWYARTLPPGYSIHHPTESLYHPEIPWARCTPDGIVQSTHRKDAETVTVPEHGIQAKNAAFWSGKRWDGGPPDEVQIQCQWEMFVTGLQRDDVIAALGGMPPQVWTVYRDDALIADLLAAGRKFWALVENKTPPAIDHSDDWRARFAKQIRATGLVVPAAPETDELASRLRDARAQSRAADRACDQIKNELCAVMADGGTDAIETHLGLVTWREAKGKTSWKDVAAEMGDRLGMTAKQITQLADAKRGDPSRTFNVPREWDKEH